MDHFISTSIRHLAEGLKSEDRTQLNKLIKQLEQEGTPLVEKDPNNQGSYLVTFIWIGNKETNNVFVFGSFPGWDLQTCQLERLEDTNLWFKTYSTHEKLVSTYQFSINDQYGQNWLERSRHYQPDPYNKKSFLHAGDFENPHHNDTMASIIELQMQIQSDTYRQIKPVPQGKVMVHRFYSKILQSERRIWVYTPHDYSIEQAPYNLIVALDGRATFTTLAATTTLDTLIYEKRISPCIMIGIDCADRFEELVFNTEFTAFVGKELIPWIRESYHISHDPSHITICGFSLGGLAAFFIGTKYPELIGNILTLSGSVHWKKEGYSGNIPWIEHYFRTNSKLSLKIYMSAGKLENKPLLEANQNLHKEMAQLGYHVHYDEFCGGHDEIWWREKLQTGLKCLSPIDNSGR